MAYFFSDQNSQEIGNSVRRFSRENMTTSGLTFMRSLFLFFSRENATCLKSRIKYFHLDFAKDPNKKCFKFPDIYLQHFHGSISF